jgi:hypothetical protein
VLTAERQSLPYGAFGALPHLQVIPLLCYHSPGSTDEESSAVRHMLRSAALAAIALTAVSPLVTQAAPRPSGHGASGKHINNVVRVPAGWPKQLDIPRFGIQAHVESLALNTNQDAQAPYHWNDVAWYNRSPRPGEVGRAVVYGHLDSVCCPAVFYHLRDAKKGDTVRVLYKSGKPLTFRILWTASYVNSKLPDKFMYAATRERGLVMVTCTGVFRPGLGYDHKFIAYARLVLPNGSLG